MVSQNPSATHASYSSFMYADSVKTHFSYKYFKCQHVYCTSFFFELYMHYDILLTQLREKAVTMLLVESNNPFVTLTDTKHRRF